MMDTSLTFAPKAAAATPYMAKKETVRDTKVPVAPKSDDAATLPANKPFLAQGGKARPSGTEFPEQPSEITPTDRTLRPYDTPMLPSNGDTAETQDTAPQDSNAKPDA